MVRAGSGDRIILFTLVDLLLQIMFFGFFIFAANRATEGEMQDKIGALARKFGVVSVTRYMNATSKLVAISDLHHIDVVGSAVFRDVTTVLEGLNPDAVRGLASLKPKELQAFARAYATLPAPERHQVAAFLAKHGNDAGTLLRTAAQLPPEDLPAMMKIDKQFANADPAKRKKIVEAAMVKPLCFKRRTALHITEVPGGYIVRPLIPDVARDVARATSSSGAIGTTYRFGQADFQSFAASVAGAHEDCIVNVQQDTTTNDERQFKTIQRYFGTW